MVLLKEQGLYITKIEDLRDVVSPEIYEAIEHVVNNKTEYDELKDDYKNLEYEFKSYEATLEDVYATMRGVQRILENARKIIQELESYVDNSNRINRGKIISELSSLNKKYINEILDELNMRL